MRTYKIEGQSLQDMKQVCEDLVLGVVKCRSRHPVAHAQPEEVLLVVYTHKQDALLG